MELLQLRYFQMIARLESVTQAAAFFQVPQSAMSQTLKRLEHELGDVQLFDRRKNHLFLNDTGRHFLAKVDEALLLIDSGVREVSARAETISGPIHILVMENRRFITYCVSKFAEIYPDVNFNICHDFYSGLDDEYDICIAAQNSYKQMKSSIPLIQEPIILAVHESHPLANRKSVSLSELWNDKFITMSRHSSLYTITYESCRASGFEPHVPYICDDPYFVRKYISLNMGIALAPSVSWAGRFRNNTKVISLVEPGIITTSYALWNQNRYQSKAMIKFLEFLKDEAAKIEGNLLSQK